MDTRVIERRHVRLHKVGGSKSLVIPKEWLVGQGIDDEADLVLTTEGIRIEAPSVSAPTIEDEPLLPAFLEMLLADALAHPEKLVDAGEMLAEDAAWLADLAAE